MTEGENRDWVLLRGLTRDGRHWEALPAVLEARMPGARVVCIDLPGNGGHARERSAVSIAANVAACRQQLADARLRSPFNLLSLSLGAMVATEWSLAHPEEVNACVLLNTSMRPYSPWYRRLSPSVWKTLLGALATGDAARRERAVLAATSQRYRPATPAGDAVVARWAGWFESARVTRANAVRQLIAAARYRCRGTPVTPMLLLASQRDALVDIRCSRAIASAWGCPLHEHPQAGHDLPLDDPDWVVAQTALWLTSHC